MPKQVKRFGKSMLAVLLAVAFVFSGMNVAGWYVKAEGSPPADFGTTRDYSTDVSAALTNQDAPSNDWSGFDMTITNNSGTAICDWIVKLKVPSGTASAFKCWNATFVADGDTIYMYPMQSGANAVLQTGVMQNDIPGGGFAAKYVDASSITVEAVYYNKGTSSGYDYSSGETNDETGGTGGSGSGGSLKDTVTDKNLAIEYNYAKLLQESLYFYDANMCGEIEGRCALGWRSNCHVQDKNVIYNGKTIDVSGGFHDAGDHVKFGLPQGYSATVLALSYYQFKAAYDELGQTEHYKTIMDHFCDYFKRCTVYNGDSVEAFCYQVGEGGPDHSYWGPPESQPQSTRGGAFFADSANPATDEVSVAAAALALHYINFGNAEYLKVAKDLFAFADTNKGSCATNGASGFYDSSDWKDDYCTAAAALYVATGDASYKSVLDNYYTSNNIKTGWVLTWDNTWAVASVLLKDWSTVNAFASYGNTNTAQGFKLVDGWGSARYNTTLQFLGLIYDQGNGQFSTDKGSFAGWATGQMNYLLGNNNNKRCFVVGYNENSSKYPHHRAASRSNDAGTTVDNHYTLLGALVGGPSDANDTYADNQADYNCNEVALDYNAGFVGAAAGLYLLHKNNVNVKKDLLSEEEIAAIVLNGISSGNGSSGSGSTNTGSGNTGNENSGSGSGNTGNGSSGSGSGNKDNGNENDNNTIVPALKTSNILMQKGKTYTLTTKHKDVKITRVSYSNSKSKKLVKASSSGKIKAKKIGTAKLKVTYEYNGATYNKTVKVKVQKNAVYALNKKNISVKIRRKVKCNLVNPANMLSSKGMKFKTSNKKVAAVSSKGLVTAKKKGKAKITVTMNKTKYIVNVTVK